MSYFMLLVYVANFIFSILIVFVERKKPFDALAWLLVLSLLPAVGFVFYIFIGSTLSFRLDSLLSRKSQLDKELDALLNRDKTSVFDRLEVAPEAEEYHELVRMLENVGNCAYTQDNDVALLVNGQAFFPRLLKDIEAAQHSIHIEFFIFEARDTIGKSVLEALARRASAGVDVRLIYDAMGALRNRPHHFKALRQAGGRVYRHLPSMAASILNANYLNHRKIVVIDGAVGYTGGINVGDAYLGHHKRCRPWRDTMIRLTGSSVGDLQVRFMKDWRFLEKRMRIKDPLTLRPDHFPPLTPSGRMGVQVISSGPDTPYEPIKNGMITMMYAATKRISVQSPYLIPDESFMSALINAAASGLRVEVMLPGIGDKDYVYHVTKSNIEPLLEAGVHVYFYRGFLHAKMMLVDDKVVTIGTTNVDIRSFQLDFEVNAFIYDKAFCADCRAVFDDDLAQCDELSLEAFKKRSVFSKILESIYRLFSPIM